MIFTNNLFTKKQTLLYTIISVIILFIILIGPIYLFRERLSVFVLWQLIWNPWLLIIYTFWLTILSSTGWIFILKELHYYIFKKTLSINWQLTKKHIIIWICWWIILFILNCLIGIILEYFSWLLGYTPHTSNDDLLLLWSISPLVVVLFITFAWACEEILFRWVLQDYISKITRPLIGLVLSSIVFTLLHTQYDIIWLLNVFILSILLGLIYNKYSSLWCNMIVHGVNNLIASTILILPLIWWNYWWSDNQFINNYQTLVNSSIYDFYKWCSNITSVNSLFDLDPLNEQSLRTFIIDNRCNVDSILDSLQKRHLSPSESIQQTKDLLNKIKKDVV